MKREHWATRESSPAVPCEYNKLTHCRLRYTTYGLFPAGAGSGKVLISTSAYDHFIFYDTTFLG